MLYTVVYSLINIYNICAFYACCSSENYTIELERVNKTRVDTTGIKFFGTVHMYVLSKLSEFLTAHMHSSCTATGWCERHGTVLWLGSVLALFMSVWQRKIFS